MIGMAWEGVSAQVSSEDPQNISDPAPANHHAHSEKHKRQIEALHWHRVTLKENEGGFPERGQHRAKDRILVEMQVGEPTLTVTSP